MKKKYLRSLTLCFITSLSIAIQAQVSIGSKDTPLIGSLLDLKQDGDVTTKGLAMPRVNITNLAPSSSTQLAASIGNSGNWNLIQHTALTVYNLNQVTCPASGNPILKGTYVFNGTQWQYINSYNDVYYEADNRVQKLGGQTYPYRRFGAAGDWMLENLRYIPIDGSIFPSAGSGATTTSKFYTYPNANPASPANAPSNWKAPQGVLYTYSAATLGLQDAVTENQAAISGTNGPATPIQGVCPDGWHIPNDREWNELEYEIYTNAGKYSTYTDAELSNTAIWNPVSAINSWNTSWYNGLGFRGSTGTGGHALAMQSPCTLPGSPFGATGGKSLLSLQGGFNALLVGTVVGGTVSNYGNKTGFMSSSTANATDSWNRYVYRVNGRVERIFDNRTTMLPIRCKR